MSNQVLEQQPTPTPQTPGGTAIDNSSPVPAETEANLAEYRAEREAENPRTERQSQEAEAERTKPRGGFQRRIDQLTREKSEVERQRDDAVARLRKYESGQPADGRTTQQPPQNSEQPAKRESLKELAERLERETGQAAKPDAGAQQAAQAPTPEQQEFQRQHIVRAQGFHQRIEEVTKADPEFAAARKAPSRLVPIVLHPAMVDLDNGHDVAVYLAKNPEMQDRITMLWQAAGDAAWQATGNQQAALHAANLAAIRVVHRLGAALEFGSIGRRAEPKPRPVSQAPTPITPVGNGGGAPEEPDWENEDISLADYRRSRRRH